MNSHAWRLIKVARTVARRDPLLGHELEQQIRQYIAVINPNAKSADQDLESMVTVLKSLRQELEDIIKKMDADEDAEEFAKFFDDEAAAEEEELRRLLKDVKSASSRTAGPKEWLKNLFKRKKDKGSADKDAPSGLTPSYEMTDMDMDDFVDGKADWDSAKNIKEEANEKKDFESTVQKILDQVAEARKKPSMQLIEKLIDQISKAVTHGEHLMKGAFKYKAGPGEDNYADSAMDDSEDVDLSQLDSSKSDSKLTPEMKKSVDQYVDAIKGAKGDDKKTLQFLRELFDEVKPALEYESVFASAIRQAQLAPGQLVRYAHANPELRPVLLPMLRSMTASLKAPKADGKNGHVECDADGDGLDQNKRGE